MDISILAVKFLGIISIILASGLSYVSLPTLGISTYLKFQDGQKKIEVRTRNSNRK